jgi:hypothetical protein
MKHLRPRLTYSNVVATLALFIAVTGATAFAASQLGKNSVGSKQLKKNAVTPAKIKKNAVTTAKIKGNAVTGAKVNESTLETVPSANVANSLSPMEATHIVGNPGEPAFENGSHNLPSEPPFNFNPVGFYKDHEGIVHLQGIAETGKTSPGFVFALPPGFRPAAGRTIFVEQFQEASGIIFGGSIFLSGFDLSGKILGLETEAPVVLDGVTFRAES